MILERLNEPRRRTAVNETTKTMAGGLIKARKDGVQMTDPAKGTGLSVVSISGSPSLAPPHFRLIKTGHRNPSLPLSLLSTRRPRPTPETRSLWIRKLALATVRLFQPPSFLSTSLVSSSFWFVLLAERNADDRRRAGGGGRGQTPSPTSHYGTLFSE